MVGKEIKAQDERQLKQCVEGNDEKRCEEGNDATMSFVLLL